MFNLHALKWIIFSRLIQTAIVTYYYSIIVIDDNFLVNCESIESEFIEPNTLNHHRNTEPNFHKASLATELRIVPPKKVNIPDWLVLTLCAFAALLLTLTVFSVCACLAHLKRARQKAAVHKALRIGEFAECYCEHDCQEYCDDEIYVDQSTALTTEDGTQYGTSSLGKR